MEAKQLYKAVEEIASQSFSSEKDMLVYSLMQLIEIESINVTGGRIWELDVEAGTYCLLFQTGKVEKIDPGFKIKISDYPIFDLIAKDRTIVDTETNMILRSKGIFKYSASGIGDKKRYNGKIYFDYLIALNSDDLNESFRLNLNIISTALTAQIKAKRYHTRARTLKADLDKARELQKSILPNHQLNFHNYEMFGVTVPAEIVGGDFFDYIDIGIDGDRLGIAVGDAASKGVAAAAEALYISGALRMACNFEIKIYLLMKRMNQLVNKIFADDKFASFFYGELSKDKGGMFQYSNAGHNPPMFVKAKSDKITYLETTGPVLGPAPVAAYGVENINFETGDTLLIFSDGVTEATDSDFNFYGEDRLSDILVKNKEQSARDICYNILDDLMKFSKFARYNDDKTLVVIKRIK